MKSMKSKKDFKEIKKEIDRDKFLVEDLQARRHIVNLLSQIGRLKKKIGWDNRVLEFRRKQLSGEMFEKDPWDNLKSKELLRIDLEILAVSIDENNQELNYLIEDLKNFTKGCDLQKIKVGIQKHYVEIGNWMR